MWSAINCGHERGENVRAMGWKFEWRVPLFLPSSSAFLNASQCYSWRWQIYRCCGRINRSSIQGHDLSTIPYLLSDNWRIFHWLGVNVIKFSFFVFVSFLKKKRIKETWKVKNIWNLHIVSHIRQKGKILSILKKYINIKHFILYCKLLLQKKTTWKRKKRKIKNPFQGNSYIIFSS